jgi:Na+/H+-dicarboxylate symporter
MSLVCAVGSAGIPMAALVMMAVILNVAGLPLEGIGLVIGVDRLLDMMRTTLNVYGDTCVAVMVAKSEGESLKIDR